MEVNIHPVTFVYEYLGTKDLANICANSHIEFAQADSELDFVNRNLTSSQMTIPTGDLCNTSACKRNVSYEIIKIGIGARICCCVMKVTKSRSSRLEVPCKKCV